MSVILLSIYIALIFIRPMDWYPPILDWQLVTAAAIGTLIAGFPRVLESFPRAWKAIPQVRASIWMLIGVTLSFIPWLQGVNTSFQEFSKIVFLYLMIVLLTMRDKSFRILLWTVLLCIGWMAVHGVLLGTLGHGFGPIAAHWRPSRTDPDAGVWQIVAYGIFEDPNDLCLVFIIAIPLLYAEYATAANFVLKAVCWVMIGLNLYAAWLTNSRGGIVGIFGMMAAYVIGRLKGFKRWAMIVFCVGLITIGMPARGSELGVFDKARLSSWGDGIRAFIHSPITGIGYNNYGSISGGIAAHNTYINAAAELGLLGYVPFFLILYLTFVHLRRGIALQDRIARTDRIRMTGMFSALIGYLTSLYFLSRTYNHVLYVLLGLAISRVLLSCRDQESFQLVFKNPRDDMKRGFWLALASIAFIYFSVRLGNAMS